MVIGLIHLESGFCPKSSNNFKDSSPEVHISKIISPQAFGSDTYFKQTNKKKKLFSRQDGTFGNLMIQSS